VLAKTTKSVGHVVIEEIDLQVHAGPKGQGFNTPTVAGGETAAHVR